jgi:hypothetical protein
MPYLILHYPSYLTQYTPFQSNFTLHFSYLCTYELYGPVFNDFDAGITIYTPMIYTA